MKQFALSPRWLPWHLFCLASILVMIRLGFWQMGRGIVHQEPGAPAEYHLLNVFYAVQWWIFAGFAAWFWWRFLRDQKASEDAAYAEYVASQGHQG